MIYLNLIRHELLKAVRSKAFYKNVLTNIFYGIFGVYMAVMLFLLGLVLDEILEGFSSVYDPTQLMLRIMIYLIIISVSLRFLMQQLSTVSIQNYLTLPVKRSKLIRFLLLKPLLNPANYITLLLFVPFALRSTAAYYDGLTAFKFILLIVFVIWFDSFMASYLKRQFGSSIKGIIGMIVAVGALIALDYYHVLPLSEWSGAAFEFVLFSSMGWMIPLVFVAGAYLLNILYFKNNFYLDTYNRQGSGSGLAVTHLSFLDRFGKIGSIIELEIKLILRHKRTKSFIYLSVLFLFYGLIFYPQMDKQPTIMLFFVAIFTTGLLMLLFGQWVISWDSMYFDGLMTANISSRDYIEANYYLMAGFCIISFILTSPYFFFGSKIIYLHFAALCINLGLNVFFYVFTGTFNTKRLDLTKSNAMNYQGVTVKNFVALIPILVFPILCMWILEMFFSFEVTMLILAVVGLVGVAFHRQLIDLCAKQFQRRKHVLAESFRESE